MIVSLGSVRDVHDRICRPEHGATSPALVRPLVPVRATGGPVSEGSVEMAAILGIDMQPTDPHFRPLLRELLRRMEPGARDATVACLEALEPPVRDQILAFLLWQPEPGVRDAALKVLARLPAGSSELLWRVCALRSDLDEPAIALWRGAPPKQGSTGVPTAPCSDCHVSIPDGSGHVTFFMALNSGGSHTIALCLLHVTRGWLDVEILAHPTAEIRDRVLRQMRADLDLHAVAPSRVHALLRDVFLLSGGDRSAIPPKIVDLLPLLWRRDIAAIVRGGEGSVRTRARPATASLERYGSFASAGDVRDWEERVPLLESWMSVAALKAPVAGDMTSRLQRVFFHLEEERGTWLANLRWSAVLLGHCGEGERRLAATFDRIGASLTAGVPMRDIPLFQRVALRTALNAERHRMEAKPLGS